MKSLKDLDYTLSDEDLVLAYYNRVDALIRCHLRHYEDKIKESFYCCEDCLNITRGKIMALKKLLGEEE